MFQYLQGKEFDIPIIKIVKTNYSQIIQVVFSVFNIYYNLYKDDSKLLCQ